MRIEVARSWIDRLASAGALPGDTPEERLRKAALTLSAAAIAALAAVWVGIYAALGLWDSAAVPFAYQVITVASIGFFFRTRNFALFRFTQLLLILLLPFVLQWTVGGFVVSGAVMVWAVTAPFGALVFCGPRKALPWLAAYLALIGVSGAIDGVLPDEDIPTWLVLTYFTLNIGIVSIVAYGLLHNVFSALAREHAKLAEEQARSERLLLNILPQPIAERLKASDGVIADGYDEVTVLFADIVGFTQLAETMAPTAVVELLNEVFSSFDELVEEHGLEKIKTIGDGYMVAGGLPHPRDDHAEAIAETALLLREKIGQIEAAARCRLEVRMGIDSGPVVAGVIGKRKFSYDLWGDTVNTASRMESHSSPGSIQVTERAYRRLHGLYAFEPQTVDVKGKGPMATYLLVGRRDKPAAAGG